MPSVLLVYGSWNGSTARVARHLRQELTLHGLEVSAAPATSAPDPASFDAVVIGSAVRSGEWHPAAMDWLKRHALKLRQKPVAVFSVCLTPACRPERLSEARGYSLPLRMELGLQPVSESVFAGAHDPSRLKLGDRLKARSVGARAGDYIEPQAIDEWAGQVGRLLAN